MLITLAISVAAGAFSWSFAEYALHNWYGHVAKGKNEFSREHLTHHAQKGYFAPTAKKAQMALPVMFTAAIAASLLATPLIGLTYTASFALTYVAYETFHYRMHIYPPKGPIGRWLRKHHFYHHFQNPWKNHGVTSPIWDMVFGSYVKAERIRIPECHALDWLLDAEGEVKPEYLSDYEVMRYRKSKVQVH